LIANGRKKVVITGDTSRDIPEKSRKLMLEPDLLIANAIIPPHGTIPKHMNSKEAMELAWDLNAKKVVLTHLSHKFSHTKKLSKIGLLAMMAWNLNFDFSGNQGKFYL